MGSHRFTEHRNALTSCAPVALCRRVFGRVSVREILTLEDRASCRTYDRKDERSQECSCFYPLGLTKISSCDTPSVPAHSLTEGLPSQADRRRGKVLFDTTSQTGVTSQCPVE